MTVFARYNKYTCLTLADNGKLYAAPWGAAQVLEINPWLGVVREIGPQRKGVWLFRCLTPAGNGKLYAAPFAAGKVLEILEHFSL